jgi:tRNA pseudouridine55 synthase
MFSSSDKTYEASVRLGVATDTDDAAGQPIGEPAATLPSDAEIDAALEAFRGTFEQTPPDYSAKKVGGHKAYDLARRDGGVELKPVTVTVHALERIGLDASVLSLRVTASAGFYVRALARDLGAKLGCGAHLSALRRTRSGDFDVRDAVPLERAERLGPDVAPHVLTAMDALAHLPLVHTTELGLKRAQHGNPLGPEHLTGRWLPPATAGVRVRVAGPGGELVALAESRGGALHPVVVLG